MLSAHALGVAGISVHGNSFVARARMTLPVLPFNLSVDEVCAGHRPVAGLSVALTAQQGLSVMVWRPLNLVGTK